MRPPIQSAATHGGRYHADDVLAAALLVAALLGVRIVRTRDPLGSRVTYSSSTSVVSTTPAHFDQTITSPRRLAEPTARGFPASASSSCTTAASC